MAHGGKSERGDRAWSHLTVTEIERYIEWLTTTIPLLEDRLSIAVAHGSKRGADVELILSDASDAKHRLLIEAEQYASGKTFERKIKHWARRHGEKPNTTTVIFALLLPAIRNRLQGMARSDEEVKRLIYAASFRIFPGTGDGRVPDELKNYLLAWIEARL